MKNKWNVSDLKQINPHDSKPVQPKWIMDQYPDYVRHHMPLAREEQFTHKGHHVKITTTYQVEINGQPVMLHSRINEKQEFECHATPYLSHRKLKDLVTTLLDNNPIEAIPRQSSRKPPHQH